jgi:hypothetical protein
MPNELNEILRIHRTSMHTRETVGPMMKFLDQAKEVFGVDFNAEHKRRAKGYNL